MHIQMTSKQKKTLILAAMIVGLVIGFGIVNGLSFAAPTVETSTPQMVSYQGQVVVDGSPYSGTGYFKFAIVNEAETETYWGNDGNIPPVNSISLAVVNGLFHVNLGDISLTNMVALGPDAFSGSDRYLQVSFSINDLDFTTLPVTRIASVPYALVADTLDGMDSTEFALSDHNHDTRYYTKTQVDALLSQGYANVIVVAKSGGDYTSLEDAVSSITDAAVDNLYLVWIAPGVYEEKPLQLKPYIHIQGAGQGAVTILSTANADINPPNVGALTLASHSSLRDLSVVNLGEGSNNTAILANQVVTSTVIKDVNVKAEGNGDSNFAIYLNGSDIHVTFEDVQASASTGIYGNYAMQISSGAQAVIHGGEYTARGNSYSAAFGLNSGAVLSATDVIGVAEGESSYGIHVINGSKVTVKGGSLNVFGVSPGYYYGIYATGTDTTLFAEDVQVTVRCVPVQGYIADVYGLRNSNGSSAQLIKGVYSVEGDLNIYGIRNEGSGTNLVADGVQVSASGTGDVYGLMNSASSQLLGGSFYAEGGDNVYGIYNDNPGSRLKANDVYAHGKYGLIAVGLWNDYGIVILTGGEYVGETGATWTSGIINNGQLYATNPLATGLYGLNQTYGLGNAGGVAELNGGTYLADNGYAGVDAYGLFNNNGDLAVADVIAIGRYAGSENYGLQNIQTGNVEIQGGSFTGIGGDLAIGIYNTQSTLSGTHVMAIGKDGIISSEGLRNGAKAVIATTELSHCVLEGLDYSLNAMAESVYLSHCQFYGTTFKASSSSICVASTQDYTWYENTCP